MSTTNINEDLVGQGAAREPRPDASASEHRKLRFPRRFTSADVAPFDEVEWDLRSAAITKENGEVVFEQSDIEVPRAWTQMATNVVASKYFRGHIGTRPSASPASGS